MPNLDLVDIRESLSMEWIIGSLKLRTINVCVYNFSSSVNFRSTYRWKEFTVITQRLKRHEIYNVCNSLNRLFNLKIYLHKRFWDFNYDFRMHQYSAYLFHYQRVNNIMHFICSSNKLELLIRTEMYTVAFLYNIHMQKTVNLPSWFLLSTIYKAYFYVIFIAFF